MQSCKSAGDFSQGVLLIAVFQACVFQGRHWFKPCTSGKGLWSPLQRLLLEMILLVLVVDQSQSLTWVMVTLSTVLSSAVLPWWQKEGAPACQSRGSAESWRVTESLTFLSVWLAVLLFIDTETHTQTRTLTGVQRSHVVVGSFSPCSLFSVSLKILQHPTPLGITFKSLMLSFKAALEAACLCAPVQTNTPTLADIRAAFLCLHSQCWGLRVLLSLEYAMMAWPSIQGRTAPTLSLLTWSGNLSQGVLLLCFDYNSNILLPHLIWLLTPLSNSDNE